MRATSPPGANVELLPPEIPKWIVERLANLGGWSLIEFNQFLEELRLWAFSCRPADPSQGTHQMRSAYDWACDIHKISFAQRSDDPDEEDHVCYTQPMQSGRKLHSLTRIDPCHR
jgi:hypothetical protein